MASLISIIALALKLKWTHLSSAKYVEQIRKRLGEEYHEDYIEVHAQPFKRCQCLCPKCRRKCPGYDTKASKEVTWRANAINGVSVYIKYKPRRIQCKEHGVLTEEIPWSDGTTRFTAGFNDEAAYLALSCPRTVVSHYMGIDWKTVGNCIKAAHNRIEPDVTQRLHGLKRICVDETSYKRGHKYITVVYDLDRNQVVWLHRGHGLEIFTKFCKTLAQEECEAITVVAGDGARWIDSCTKEYFPNALRCVDFFHVAGWVNDCLDKVRNSARRTAETEVNQLRKKFDDDRESFKKEIKSLKDKIRKEKAKLNEYPKKGRPSREKIALKVYIEQLEAELEKLTSDSRTTDVVTEEEYNRAVEELAGLPKRGRNSRRKTELKAIIAIYEQKNDGDLLSDVQKKVIADLRKKADELKGSKYALGMNPENLDQRLRDKLSEIEADYPDLYKAYRFKERLRAILHMKDAELAAESLDEWISETQNCEINEFAELSEKIERHRENILHAIRLQVNSSRSESTNTTIKATIAVARGFRNLENMFALVYLKCSDLVIPLNNRYTPSIQKTKELRGKQNNQRRQREEARREMKMQKEASACAQA